MSRPIKFRAWNCQQKCWASSGIGMTRTEDSVSIVPMGAKTGSELVLMQYTGLKDRNGVEIYEGDIVKYRYMDEGRSVVKYSNLYPSYEPFNQLRHSIWETIEVIGNLYENPELLEAAS